MGYGEYSAPKWDSMKEDRESRGESDFKYSEDTTATGRPEVHPDLDPKDIYRKGKLFRESRDSVNHPQSTPVSVFFDETGSMDVVPQLLAKKLTLLPEVLENKAYITDPQIMFGAVGDATYCRDFVPLQIGQWESDVSMDVQLRNIVLEGEGGGYGQESYELVFYMMARHTDMDCWNKRGQKGYLILILDEKAYPYVKAEKVRELVGDTLRQDIRFEDIVAEVQQRFNVFCIIPHGTTGANRHDVRDYWERQLGGKQFVFSLEDPAAVCETIAMLIGLVEDVVSIDEAKKDLKAIGADPRYIESASKALTTYTNSLQKGSNTGLSGLKKDDDKRGGSKRL